VGDRARIGVVGPNGGGKSTLMRLLAGSEEPDDGTVARRRGLRVAMLPQRLEPDPRTPRQIVRAARPDLEQIELELEQVAARLAEPALQDDLARMERVLRRQHALIEQFDQAGGHIFEGRAQSLLIELGVPADQIDQPTDVRSGGMRKLIALAAELASEPDLLLLDEPETHLDTDARRRLEGVIRGFEGGVVTVSHDRYLLDETVNQIAELDRARITLWQGGYSAYVSARELALQRQMHHHLAQQKEIARLEEMIRRFKHWFAQGEAERYMRQAKAKQRQIDRMEKIERPVLERRKMALALRSARRGGQRVVELRGAGVELGGVPVLIGVDLTVMRGERVGVIGANGAGKSVLLRMLTGELELDEGERWIGPSIELGYLRQEPSGPGDNASPIEAVRRASPCTEDEAVQVLTRFLFNYEQLRQPIARMSGGERTRLELLLLMRGGANCLVLDEPTNHLDIDAVEVLEDALERYDGTVIAASHDRYFLDRIADRIVEVGDGEAHAHEGGFSAWERRRLEREAARR